MNEPLIPRERVNATIARRAQGNRKLLLALGLTLLAGCKHDPPAADAPEPKVDGAKITIPANAPQQKAIAVEAADSPKALITHLTGRLVWNDDLTVRVFSPVAGRVDTIVGTLGQTVTVGSALARIASPDYGQAQADARRAIGDLELSERSLNRTRELNAHGAAANKDVEAAEADYTRALSEKERASARMTLYGGNDQAIDQMFVLKSPLAGMIVEKNINPGQEVRPDQMLANAPQLFAPLFVISDPAKLWLLLDATETQASALSAGQPLKLHSQAFPGRAFDGKLLTVGNSLDPVTRTARVVAEVDNHEGLLKAEMYVTVDVVKQAEDNLRAVTISSNCVFLLDSQYYVFIEHQPGEYERKLVKLGTENEGRILVTEGIAAGQKVVSEGVLLLQGLLD